MERNALRITAKFGQLGQRFDILYSRFDKLRQREVLSMTKCGSIYSRAELISMASSQWGNNDRVLFRSTDRFRLRLGWSSFSLFDSLRGNCILIVWLITFLFNQLQTLFK